jgi:molybdenum cofactor synthesis domain-containing protein
MIRVAILTMSDKGAKGEREDESGKTIEQMLDPSTFEVTGYEIIPDEFDVIVSKLMEYSEETDVILTTGGTGLSPRDVTPEATLKVVERTIPGICEAMRAMSMRHTNRAMLSRAVAGIRGKCLIINMPGSPKAVEENLGTIRDVIPHAVEKIKGSQKECAR